MVAAATATSITTAKNVMIFDLFILRRSIGLLRFCWPVFVGSAIVKVSGASSDNARVHA